MLADGFKIIDVDTAMLVGRISHVATREMKAWLKDLRSRSAAGVLLLDSPGGIIEPSLLVSIIETPLHVHVLGRAESWGMCIALCASILTANPNASFGLHAPRYSMAKGPHHERRDRDYIDECNYRISSILSSVVPAGAVREEIVDALCYTELTNFDSDWLQEELVIEKIAPIDLFNMRDQDLADEIERKYND